jgi:aspartyl-tRNA(Asn)/glutamyl-tRNA(Gln) amidotransferase subunit A
MSGKPSLDDCIPALAQALAEGRTSARALVEEALSRIADPATYLRVYGDAARAAADAHDRLRAAGYVASPLAGIPVSIKDLFDVAGEVTRAGSKALADAPPARADAAIVARLKAAGAVIIGRTNMTEFAFSGIGINPHYGTPGNPFDRARIPGGSSSGAGVAVKDGSCAVAIGTDTGGSVRIPAALCGVAGLKPTQRRVPLAGCYPLSSTLDSIGPLAKSVASCAIADAVMAGETPAVPAPLPPQGLRLAVPQTLVLDGMDENVSRAFARALDSLSRAGARIVEAPFAVLGRYLAINATGGFAAAEAFAWHRELLARRGAAYDPRVRVRIERGGSMSAADYVTLAAERKAFIADFDAEAEPYDALLCPTVPVVAPLFSAFADDKDYARLNMLILRNPGIVNFLDRCAVTLPIARAGDAPAGLMVVGRHGSDRRLLALAQGLEAALA